MNEKQDTKDLFVLGSLAGLAGSAGDFVVHHLAYLIFKTSTTAMYISQLIFPFERINWIQYIYGLVIHFFTGGVVGIILVEFYRKYGDKYPYFKAISLGVGFWIVHVAIIPNIINQPNRPYLHRTELEALVDLTAHIIFGVCAAAYLKSLEFRVKS